METGQVPALRWNLGICQIPSELIAAPSYLKIPQVFFEGEKNPGPQDKSRFAFVSGPKMGRQAEVPSRGG